MAHVILILAINPLDVSTRWQIIPFNHYLLYSEKGREKGEKISVDLIVWSSRT